ncbi:RxLR-like protein [Plasmopara halstedii]|uniref:RxLR-like protein n=1 Tax=Plasmopara halstedii TaxID=4781 RepID=A0A0P1AE28_PLAHL|nr:RxLR-like protein [Plasmopara halstedii]CEG39157.1 RxLR-like protein [Plasmopara halstedii]|eukprot:XP_024575526.1 RxLR-like protein [Plasmopara halstedii]
MRFASSIIAASVAFSISVNADHTSRQLILGGSKVKSNTKTYTVGIRNTTDGDNFCAGALVSSRHVITTVLCTYFGTDGFGPRFVSVGSHNLNGRLDGEQIEIASIKTHKKFDDQTLSYDFALLTLKSPSKFKPITLPKADNSDITPNMMAQVMGWGQTSYENDKLSDDLRGVQVPVWTNDECRPHFTCDESALCAGGKKNQDACIGDSGAPLIKENGAGDSDDVLIGLASYGTGCGTEGIPSVYSRVSAVVQWIKSQL